MANWNNPTLTSLYVDFLAELKARDVDVLTMNPGTNIPVNAKRLASIQVGTVVLQSWDGASWINHIIDIAGGGTSASSAAGARTNLGIGTMGTQNSNAVAITGGTITGVNLNANDITSGIVALSRGGTGVSMVLGPVGSYLNSNGSTLQFTYFATSLIALNASNVTVGNLPMAQMPLGGFWNISGASPFVAIQGGTLIVGPLSSIGPGVINAQAYYLNDVPFVPGSGVPAGMMAYFVGACPAGWTFVAGSSGRVVKSLNGATGQVGGANTHTHEFSVPAGGGGSINSGPANGDVSSPRAMTGNNRSFDSGSSFSGFLPADSFNHDHTIGHTHNFNVPGFPGHNGPTGPADSWPPFIEFNLCSKN